MIPKQSVGRAMKISLRGTILLLKERSFRIQIFIGVVITFLGFYFEIESWAWVAQITSIGLVLMAEGINTVIERIADIVQPEYDPKIGNIKDMAAGFVGIMALTASLVAVIIYAPKFGLV